MKTFQEFVESSQKGSHPIRDRNRSERDMASKSHLHDKTQYMGWTVVSSIHARARAFERVHHLTQKDWKEILRRTVKNVGQVRGDVVFFSKSFDQGFVARVIPKSKEIRVITVLPKGKQQEKEGTDKLVFEQLGVSELTTWFID